MTTNEDAQKRAKWLNDHVMLGDPSREREPTVRDFTDMLVSAMAEIATETTDPRFATLYEFIQEISQRVAQQEARLRNLEGQVSEARGEW